MNLLLDEPEQLQSDLTLVLAHGAGAGMDTDFMQFMAHGVGAQGIRVARFEFPYMAQRRQGGSKQPPDRMPVLQEAFQAVVAQLGGGSRCVAGGKSLGGRVASQLLAAGQCRAAVSLGYPFHPPRRPQQLRDQHWAAITAPWLIVQGDRDPFGTAAEVKQYALPVTVQLRWLADGDHDFKPRKSSGHTQLQHWQTAADAVANFVKGLN